MLKLTLIFLAWAGIGGAIYRFVSPTAMIVYAVATMAGFLLWAAIFSNRKK